MRVECVALDVALRGRDAGALTLTELDRLPRFSNRGGVGRGGSAAADVVAERTLEIREWVAAAQGHPLVMASEQLFEFFSSNMIEDAEASAGESPAGGVSAADVLVAEPLQVHAVEGKVYYVLLVSATGDADGGSSYSRQIAKRFSECVAIDEALGTSRRDPAIVRLSALPNFADLTRWLCSNRLDGCIGCRLARTTTSGCRPSPHGCAPWVPFPPCGRARNGGIFSRRTAC